MTISHNRFYPSKASAERILLSPVSCAFIGSLILSAIAVFRAELPDRDGMLYLETASIFLSEGLAAARASFDWVFFPVCIAFVSKLSGLGLEGAAYTLNALLLAGVCATLVRVAQAQYPSTAWYACVVVLMLPSFNGQRDAIIREFGWWLFCLQALLAALRWQRQPGYGKGLAVQLLLAAGCLFRFEAVVFFGSLAFWQAFGRLPWKQRLWRLTTLLCLPAMAGLALLALLATGQLDIADRVAYYASAANPALTLTKFKAVSAQFGAVILNHYSAKEAGSILFFGLLSTVARKFIMNYGILLIPCVVFLWKSRLRRQIVEWQPQLHFFAVYSLVLVAFVTYNLFISGRYVIFLNILTIPLIALGVQDIFERHPRWRYAFLLIALVAALANVVSLSPKKTHFREAGAWLASHPEIAKMTYIDSSQTYYFAGPAFRVKRNDPSRPESIQKAAADSRFDYLVIEDSKRHPVDKELIGSVEFQEKMRFSDGTQDVVVILSRTSVRN